MQPLKWGLKIFKMIQFSQDVKWENQYKTIHKTWLPFAKLKNKTPYTPIPRKQPKMKEERKELNKMHENVKGGHIFLNVLHYTFL